MTNNNCDSIKIQQQRKIKPTRRSVSGIYVFRSETPIEFESTLERDFLIRTEFSLNVVDIIPQPVRILYTGTNGQTYSYTPDFLVYSRLGNLEYWNYPKPVLVEIKPDKQWKSHSSQSKPKLKAAINYARKQGWTFRIYNESSIRDKALENIRFLMRYKRMQFPIEESREVLENVKQMGGAPFHYIVARHFIGLHKAEGIAHIWHLLSTRQLDCDISRPLNDFTELWVPTNE